MKKSNVIILILLLFSIEAFSQWEDEDKKENTLFNFKKDPFSVGVGVAFNAFIVQPAPDVRVTVPLSKIFNVVAEYYHYGLATASDDTSGYSNFKEFYVNLGFSAKVLQTKRFSVYLRGSYLFTQWTNENTIPRPANYHGAQMGLGADYSFKYFSIYFENTTNTVWWELNSMAGIKITKFPRIFSKPKNRYGKLLTEGI